MNRNGSPDGPRVAVIIDAFRAFATACYVLDRGPDEYFLATSSETVARLARQAANPLLIGKPELGADLVYAIPNSPTRALEVSIVGRTVIHRTQAGAKGVVEAAGVEIVLAAALVNTSATARTLRGIAPSALTLAPMGHEGVTPTLEDDLCGVAITSHLEGEHFDLAQFVPALREGSGRYFFGDDQWQYPREDFERCTARDRFDFAIRAERVDDYARLVRC
jgi:2-phosphosulfolactate phosphatase